MQHANTYEPEPEPCLTPLIYSPMQELVGWTDLDLPVGCTGALDLKPDDFQAAFASGVVGALTASQQVTPHHRFVHPLDVFCNAYTRKHQAFVLLV